MLEPAKNVGSTAAEIATTGGDAASHYALGRRFGIVGDDGFDPAQSADCFRRAADGGHPAAQLALGMMYRRGEGVTQDDAESLRWIRESARRGEAGAQFQLGISYHRASLWKRPLDDANSKVEAYMWLRLAALQGYEGSEGARDLVCLGMTFDEVAAGNRAAAAFIALDSPAVPG